MGKKSKTPPKAPPQPTPEPENPREPLNLSIYDKLIACNQIMSALEVEIAQLKSGKLHADHAGKIFSARRTQMKGVENFISASRVAMGVRNRLERFIYGDAKQEPKSETDPDLPQRREVPKRII